FEGDSTYTWSIHFPRSGDRRRVVYWFAMTGSKAALPGEFRLTDIYVKDSNGIIDTLRSGGYAVIQGGPVPGSISDGKLIKSSPHATDLFRPVITASPNPTTSTTTISVRLPWPSPSTLSIYDLHGRRVRELRAEDPRLTSQGVQWDLTDMRGRRVRAGL